MKKGLLLIVLLLCSISLIHAQNFPSEVTAHLSIGGVKEVNNLKNRGRYFHFILVSFINHSDAKIYIPDIKNMLLVSKPYSAVWISKNDSTNEGAPDALRYHLWQEMHPKDGLVVGSAVTGVVSPFSLFQRVQMESQNRAYRIAHRYRTEHKWQINSQTESMGSLADCLYLKPHEEVKNVFIVKANRFLDLSGSYKIIYQPMLDSFRTDEYPKIIEGYRKYVPDTIPSNVLYFETKGKLKPHGFLENKGK